jgi:hypothetical protein
MKVLRVDEGPGFREGLARRQAVPRTRRPLMLNLFSEEGFAAPGRDAQRALVVAEHAGAPTLNEAFLALLKVLG